MIDLHTHTLMSDGSLLPSELARRARVSGYSGLAMTDHADGSNLEGVISALRRAAGELSAVLRVVPGVELTHIPPDDIERMVERARELGASLVVGHGETIAEPVAGGTNAAFIAAGVDILAHPGLITEEDAREAAARGVFLEITARKGHCLTNGHVARTALATGAKLVINTDAHDPSDLISKEKALGIVIGAGLDGGDFERIRKNALELLEKSSA